MLESLILKLTHKMWNRHISRILCRANSDGVINSRQLHEIAAAFDPTQKHMVYGANTGRGFIPILKVAILLCIVGCGEGRNISKPSPEIQARAKVYSTSFSREVAAIEKIETVANKQDALSTQVDSFASKSLELNQEIVEQLKALNGSILETRRAVGTMEASLATPKPQQLGGDPAALEPQEAAQANQSQAHQPVASPSAVRSSEVKMSWNVEGNWNPSILETARHLREDHGFIADGLTHQQMHDAHAAFHEDRKPVAMRSPPVQMSSRGTSCPGGVCPVPRMQTRRRR